MNLLNKEITESIEQIRSNPLNHNLRLKLLQLYCISGQWAQAQKILTQYLKLNPNDHQTKALFMGNIECELKRLKCFDENVDLNAYLEDDISVNIQQKIIHDFKQNKDINELFLNLHDQVKSYFKIQLNNESEITDEIIDSDLRLSHVVEIFEENRYSVLGVHEIESIQFKPTEILTDLLWRRTEIRLKNQSHIACFVPVRYPFQNEANLDDALLYAHTTQWQSYGDFSTAFGQKTLSTPELDIGILDIQSLQSIEPL